MNDRCYTLSFYRISALTSVTTVNQGSGKMSKNVLENGVYSVTQPIPSSITSGVLMAENELFDQVFIKETNSKSKSLTLNVPIVPADEKDQAVNHNDYYRRKISSTELNPSRVHYDEESTSCCGKKTKHCIWNIVVVISLIAVVGLYSLGIVFFYTNVPENEDFFDDKLRESLLNELELCLELEDLSIETGSDTRTQTPDMCFSYTDAVCLSALQSVANRSGIHTTGDSIMVQQNPQAGSVDPDLIFGAFNSNPAISQECQIVGLPLFCQYFYPICNPDDGSLIQITEEQCSLVSDGVCQDALEFARAIPSFNIPDCSEFPSASSIMINATEEVATEVNSTEMHNTTDSYVINCHDQFDARCGMCVPSCNRFSETSEERQRTIDIFFIIAALTCVIGGTFVILVSIVRRDIMFDFPSVFIIYMTLVMMVISILVLISYAARDHLYCSHPELPLAYENPTFFCQFSGFVLHAGVLQIVLYWLLHLIHLFLKFIFPFAIRRFDTKKWKRIFHVTELILIILFTVLAPVYIVLGSKYYPYGFPPVLCVPNANLTFYTLVLPIIVMLCLGTSIIVLMLWRLQMRTEFVRKNASRISRLLRLTTAEFKVVILLCFFLTFGVVNAIYFSLYSRNYEFVLSLGLEYFYCQKDGYNATCETHKQEIESNRYYGLANTSYFLMGLLTISNFLFAVHVKQLKGQVRRLSVKAASRIRSTLNQSRGGAYQSKQSKES